MVLEAVMLCIDNSEYQRNGDFPPSRMYAQKNAANMIAKAKTSGNKESSIGVLSMAEKVEVLSTLMSDESKLFMEIHKTEPQGMCNFVAGLRVATLALKHRMNRNQRMRIIMFIGSPLGDNVQKSELVRLGKKLKKDKINVDIICFGTEVNTPQTTELLGALIDALNGNNENGESHLICVPVGADMVSVLRTSPVCASEGGAAGMGAEFGSAGDFENDPDLEMALRMSLEEHRQATGEAAPEAPAVQDQPMPSAPDDAIAAHDNVDAMTEEEQLAWAMRMSLEEHTVTSEALPAQPTSQHESTQSDTPAKASTEEGATASNDVNMDELTDPSTLEALVTDLTQSKEGEKKEEKKK